MGYTHLYNFRLYYTALTGLLYVAFPVRRAAPIVTISRPYRAVLLIALKGRIILTQGEKPCESGKAMTHQP